MKWFRFYSEIKDDPKMRKLTDDEYRLFTYLMAIAAEEDKGGIVPYNTDDLCWTLRAPLEASFPVRIAPQAGKQYPCCIGTFTQALVLEEIRFNVS